MRQVYLNFNLSFFYLNLIRCKPGFFGLNVDLNIGCLPCFCFGHSSDCLKANNYAPYLIESNLQHGNLINWTAVDSNGNSVFVGTDEINGGIFVNTNDKDVWFNAPGKYKFSIFNKFSIFTNNLLSKQFKFICLILIMIKKID